MQRKKRSGKDDPAIYYLLPSLRYRDLRIMPDNVGDGMKFPGYVGKKSELTHYAIRDKMSGKYFRYKKDSVTGDKWEWVTGINKASVHVVRSTTEYIICKFGIQNCEIVEIDEYESYKKGQYHYRVVRS